MYILVIYLIKSILARNIFFVNKCRKIFFTFLQLFLENILFSGFLLWQTFLHEKYRLFNIVVLIQQCHNGKHTSSKKNATDEDVIAVAKLAKFDKFVHNCLSKKVAVNNHRNFFIKTIY